MTLLRGKAWTFGRDIDTDLHHPRALPQHEDGRPNWPQHVMEDADPSFSSKVKPGDILVAKENFGCGSSREHAPIALKGAGVSVVIAKSFARIFYRNSFNTGLPILVAPEAVDGIERGRRAHGRSGQRGDQGSHLGQGLQGPAPPALHAGAGGGRRTAALSQAAARIRRERIHMNYDIAVMPGDGTGPEVVAEGLKVLKAVGARAGFTYDLTPYDFGGERYLRTGETLPDSAIAELADHDAIFLGAIGHPEVKPGILEQGILLKSRFELDQYINLRPVKLYPGVETPIKDKGPEDIDFVVVRENTEGLYAGTGGFLKKGHARRSGRPGEREHPQGRGALPALRLRLRPAGATGEDSSPWWARPTCSPTPTICGGGPSTRSATPTTRTSSANTPMSTPPACGSSRTPSGST